MSTKIFCIADQCIFRSININICYGSPKELCPYFIHYILKLFVEFYCNAIVGFDVIIFIMYYKTTIRNHINGQPIKSSYVLFRGGYSPSLCETGLELKIQDFIF